jgi:Lipid A Biosynthesis N-terminal domain
MTELFNNLATYLHDVFVIKFDGWVILGFVAQAFFTMRFVVQWIASERARERDPGGVLVLLDRRRRIVADLRAISTRPGVHRRPGARAPGLRA